MKTHIPVCVAIAVAFLASSAYAQYAQQNFGSPAYSNAPQTRQVGYAQPPMNPNYDSYESAVGDACGCGTDCGGQCGGRLRGGLRGRVGNRVGSGVGNRVGGGLGGRVGGGDYGETHGYDPCSPMKYLSIFGGAATFNDIGFDLNLTAPGQPPQSISAILEQNDGWTAGGAIGRSIGTRMRGEVEWSYRNATLDSAELVVNGNPQGNTDMDGQLNIYRSMSNLLFDLNPGGRFNAYFGGGVGIGFVDLDATEPTTPLTARLQTSSFVYQGIVGVSGKVSAQAELFADYRYFGTDHLEVDAAAPIGTANLNVDITSNDIFFGIRIKR